MSPQDTVERVLKDIHVMFAKCESCDGRPDKVIVDRTRFLELLDRLNRSIFDMMEAYEHTRESRTRAELAFQHKGQEMIDDASQKADDVYAASVIYTANMLGQIQSLIDEANASMNDVFRGFKRELRNQKEIVRSNELELQAQLHDMADARVYQNMLEEIRRDQRKQSDKERTEREELRAERTTPYGKGRIYTPAVSADIKINEGYFEKAGISPEDAKAGYVPASAPLTAEKPEVKVNLNAEYFKRKAAMEAKEEEEKAQKAEEERTEEAIEEEKANEAKVKETGWEDLENMDADNPEEDPDKAPEADRGRREVPAWKERMRVLLNEIAPKDINEK